MAVNVLTASTTHTGLGANVGGILGSLFPVRKWKKKKKKKQTLLRLCRVCPVNISVLLWIE